MLASHTTYFRSPLSPIIWNRLQNVVQRCWTNTLLEFLNHWPNVIVELGIIPNHPLSWFHWISCCFTVITHMLVKFHHLNVLTSTPPPQVRHIFSLGLKKFGTSFPSVSTSSAHIFLRSQQVRYIFSSSLPVGCNRFSFTCSTAVQFSANWACVTITW